MFQCKKPKLRESGFFFFLRQLCSPQLLGKQTLSDGRLLGEYTTRAHLLVETCNMTMLFAIGASIVEVNLANELISDITTIIVFVSVFDVMVPIPTMPF